MSDITDDDEEERIIVEDDFFAPIVIDWAAWGLEPPPDYEEPEQ